MATSNIKVVCRFRPVNKIELLNGHIEPVVHFEDVDTVKLASGDLRDSFTFDRVFDMQSRQEDVFDYSIRSTVDDILNGYNGTVFAYGQTGAGKSFTMMGAELDNSELRGVIPRILEQVFDRISSTPGNIEYTVKVSYMEIYMERIRDLLAPVNDNLPIHEDKARGVYVKGLLEVYVGSIEEVFQILTRGGSARATSSTNMNAESSRSHSIFVVTITQKNVETGSAKSGQLFLVDLAGSEKVGKTGASGQTLEEAKKINKSLSSLGNVINSLTDGKSTHVPYRDSKLTRILQESLGGNSRTTLIINCSPSGFNDAETLSTLRFGMRAKSIKNRAKVNAELSPTELKLQLRRAKAESVSFQEYSMALEDELGIWRSGAVVAADKWLKFRNDLNLTSGVSSATRLDALRENTNSPSSMIRSETPLPGAAGTMDRDEKDEFLRRENELQDQLAERESTLLRNENHLLLIKAELETTRQHDMGVTKQHEQLTFQFNELKLSLEKATFEQKEAYITLDSLTDANSDLMDELEAVKKALIAAKLSAQTNNTGVTVEEREQKKADKMRTMMTGFDLNTSGAEKLKDLLSDLSGISGLADESLGVLHSRMTESYELLVNTERNLVDRNAVVDSLTNRKHHLEERVRCVETEYQALLEKTISGIDSTDLAALKADFQGSFEHKREADQAEIAELKQIVAARVEEIQRLHCDIETIERSNRRSSVDLNGTPVSGKSISQQLAEFDTMRKSLMRDLQTRCERVVELEIALDETREQYNNVLRNTNNRAQQKKMAFLERNLEQLTNVQRQLVEQNSTLKKEVAIAERKLVARNDRISSLENLLGDAQEKLTLQNQKFENQLQAVRDRLDSARKTPAPVSMFGGAKIAKPLRGGATIPNELTPSPALQGIKLDATNKRSSWFRASNT